MPSVSHSEVDSFLLCRRKHYYGYTKSLQRIRESSALAMGSAGHKVLEVFYVNILDGKDFAQSLAIAKKEADELRQQVEVPSNRANIFDTLFDIYFPNEPFVKEGWEILGVEKQFNLEYDEAQKLQYPFVVDLIARSPEGKTVVIDHKFVYDFYTYEASIMQPQIPKYIGALRALNYKIDYGMYNMIRTRKLKESDATNMIQLLDVKPEPTRVKQVFTEQIMVAQEIQRIKDLPEDAQDAMAYRVANKMVCQSCSFLDICRTELVGGNGKLMMETEYKIRERKEITVSEEAE
jgi:CRISPR/Cas system-associated exonuclease Cas4 (RecB family)